MSEESVELVRQPLAVRPASRRRVEERVALRFPSAVTFLARAISWLRPRSRLRQAIVRRGAQLGIEAANRGDYEASFALYHRDVELITPPDLVGLGEASLYRGREERIAFQRKWMAEWSEFRFRADEIIDLGDRVLLLGRMQGSGLSSGATFDNEWANLLTLSAGRVIREQYFAAHAEALEAAGLRE